ncbi:hypothetical protein HY933_03605 [Candidatus Falkowbacteria bacterium]|nr:hypothetical protein [Candidatus Falkowbacteria bacterium]
MLSKVTSIGHGHDGRIKNVRALDADGNPVKSWNVIMAGEYDLGPAVQRTTISTQEGILMINGRKSCLGGPPYVIEPGQPIVIIAKQLAMYTRTYGE